MGPNLLNSESITARDPTTQVTSLIIFDGSLSSSMTMFSERVLSTLESSTSDLTFEVHFAHHSQSVSTEFQLGLKLDIL